MLQNNASLKRRQCRLRAEVGSRSIGVSGYRQAAILLSISRMKNRKGQLAEAVELDLVSALFEYSFAEQILHFG
jgi:hypothetical protein